MMDPTTARDALANSSGGGMRDSKLGDASPVLLFATSGLPEFIRQIQADQLHR